MTLTITIRTRDREKTMNPALQDALSNLLKDPKKEVPLVYQYLHNPKEGLVVDSDNKIGIVTNVRRDSHWNIIGDVVINDILRLASNFVGEIDNMAASFNKVTHECNIDAFIIYDITAKNMVDERRSKQSISLAKYGEIPIMSQSDPDMMKEISKELIKEYENMMGQQTNNLDKEE